MKLLLKEDDISKNTPLSGNVEVSRLIPAIKSAQLIFIKPVLGTELYNKILNDFIVDNLTGLYEEMYEVFIKPMLIHKSTSHYFTFGAYQITSKGIYKAGGTDGEGLTKNEIDYMVKAQDSFYQNFKNELWGFLKENEDSIPEYSTVKRTKRVNYGGWSFQKSKGDDTTIVNSSDENITWENIDW